ncbi:hypothetical protein BVI2075_120111 [Burkholderia vietnamiensis]|nr:hypothetical protein BVI2075_120111 [Burkholderia vietnamiensis]
MGARRVAASGRHRAVRVRRVEADRRHEGEEVRRLLEEGLSEDRLDRLEAGGRQQHARGAAQDRRGRLRVHDPVRAGRRPEEQPEGRPDRAPVDHPALHLAEHAEEAVRQSEGARSAELRGQQGSAREGRVRRLCDAADGRRAGRRRIRDQARAVAVRSGQGARAAEGGRLSERLRVDAVVRVQPLDRAEADPVRPAAVGAGRREGAGAGARGRRAGREGRERAGPGDGAGADVLQRLVGVDRRGELGAVAAARVHLRAAEALQHRVLQERGGRRRSLEGARDDRQREESHAVRRRAEAGVGRCAVDLPRAGEDRVRAQQAAARHLRDAGRLVQLRRNLGEMTALRLPRGAGGARCPRCPRADSIGAPC